MTNEQNLPKKEKEEVTQKTEDSQSKTFYDIQVQNLMIKRPPIIPKMFLQDLKDLRITSPDTVLFVLLKAYAKYNKKFHILKKKVSLQS